MGGVGYQIFEDPISIRINSRRNPWSNMDGVDDDVSDSASTMTSSDDNSTNSVDSSLSSDLVEDASSSYSSFASSSPSQVTKGPLYELSELMTHLPIKRGLSKHFQGKSQSFTSFSNVMCIEDLAKKEKPYGKRMKSCKSYGGGLDGNTNTNKSYIPKGCSKTISKKTPRGSFSSLVNKRSSHNNSPRSPFSLNL